MSTTTDGLVGEPSTLDPLPPVLYRGLTAVAFFGFLSFVTSLALFARLAYRLFTWKRKTQARVNQIVILIFNLIFADIQQSVAFLLNVQWLRDNAIDVGTTTCWAQGWFVSVGDFASGVFTFAIAIHSFLDIVYDYRLGRKVFLACVTSLWIFVYACAITGVAMHPWDFYVRAGAWCWINAKYTNERLWLHYIWVIIAEFGTVVVYGLIFLVLRRRVKESFYTTSDNQIRAQSAAKIIIAYPIVYVVCTLPLVTARLTTMTGGKVDFTELIVAGAMITSNGYLDVLLYTLTRRTLLLGNDDTLIDEDSRALDTFMFRPDQAYGVTTIIEANSAERRSSSRHGRKGSRQMDGGSHSRDGSQEELVGMHGVKSTTVVSTVIEPMEPMELMPVRRRPSYDMRSFKGFEK